jgi:hypothetical protein
VEAFAEALRDRERQRARLRSELALLENADELSTFDLKRIERELRARLAEWRELLRRQTPLARQLVSKLLDGRIA